MKIVIDEYKNLKQLTIPVPASHRMILLGKNGVGKTNTLEAIYFHKCRFEDTDETYDGQYLLSLDILSNPQAYYPNQEFISMLFDHTSEADMQQALLAFLEETSVQTKRPLMRKLLQDALDSLHYAAINKRFDPSVLAITRLVILNKIYQTAIAEKHKFIILLDSPELFAHPLLMDEIATVLQRLQQAGCLIIVTTHSEQFVSRLFTSFSEIIRLDKDARGLVTIKTVDMEKVSREIRAFYDQDEYLKHSFSRSTHYDTGMLKLLEHNIEGYLITAFRDFIINAFFSEVVILGEGASENVLFDYIDNELHPNWVSEFQVGFMTCMGKSTMPLYFIFLNSLGIRTFVLYDRDNTGNPVHQAYQEAFDRYHRTHKKLFRSWWLEPDLEGYLNIDQERTESIIKPVHIYNSTFLAQGENHALTRLLEIMEDNIRKL